MKLNKNIEFIKNQILRGKREGKSPSLICNSINKINGLNDQISYSVNKLDYLFTKFKNIYKTFLFHSVFKCYFTPSQDWSSEKVKNSKKIAKKSFPNVSLTLYTLNFFN